MVYMSRLCSYHSKKVLTVSLRACTCSSLCIRAKQHESVQLALSETGRAGLRASTFRLDSSFCCSWKARQQRQKTEKTLLLCFCHLSHTRIVLHPTALPASFFPSSYHVSLPHFLLSFLSPYHLMLRSIQPFLSAVVAHHFLLLSLSVFALQLGESGTMHGRDPFMEFKAGLRASRKFIKKARQQLPTCEEGKRTCRTAGCDTDFISIIFVSAKMTFTPQ